MGVGAGIQTELARVADCAGEEMESSVWRGSLLERIQLGTLEWGPFLGWQCFSLCLEVEVIIVAGISTMSALDTGDREVRAHTRGPCVSR